MGQYVHLHVCFACDENDAVAQLAQKHVLGREATPPGEGSPEASWYLRDLSRRSGSNPGVKGGLSLWGMVGNNTDMDVFVDELRPFWRELLMGVSGGPQSFEHIVVLYEEEQTRYANAVEIYLSDPFFIEKQQTRPDDKSEPSLIVRKHEHLPFGWVEM